MGFSAFKILKEGLTGNKGWKPHWREPMLKKEYDVIIIGGGAGGLPIFDKVYKSGLNVLLIEQGSFLDEAQIFPISLNVEEHCLSIRS